MQNALGVDWSDPLVHLNLWVLSENEISLDRRNLKILCLLETSELHPHQVTRCDAAAFDENFRYYRYIIVHEIILGGRCGVK
jgi:hypothetical protein